MTSRRVKEDNDKKVTVYVWELLYYDYITKNRSRSEFFLNFRYKYLRGIEVIIKKFQHGNQGPDRLVLELKKLGW